MSALAKLKLVSVVAGQKSPMVLRRNKLTGKLDEQIAYVKAANAGEIYAGKRLKTVTDEQTGERKQVQLAKRVKPWWIAAAGTAAECYKSIGVDMIRTHDYHGPCDFWGYTSFFNYFTQKFNYAFNSSLDTGYH